MIHSLRLVKFFITISVIGIALNVTPVHADVKKKDLLPQINKIRLANHLPPFVENKELSRVAQLRAEDMAKRSYFAHVSPTNVTPWDWINITKYKYSHAGENLAIGYNDSKGVVNAWLSSPSHKANILSANYRDVGYATIKTQHEGREATLVVQIFGSPMNRPMY